MRMNVLVRGRFKVWGWVLGGAYVASCFRLQKIHRITEVTLDADGEVAGGTQIDKEGRRGRRVRWWRRRRIGRRRVRRRAGWRRRRGEAREVLVNRAVHARRRQLQPPRVAAARALGLVPLGVGARARPRARDARVGQVGRAARAQQRLHARFKIARRGRRVVGAVVDVHVRHRIVPGQPAPTEAERERVHPREGSPVRRLAGGGLHERAARLGLDRRARRVRPDAQVREAVEAGGDAWVVARGHLRTRERGAAVGDVAAN